MKRLRNVVQILVLGTIAAWADTKTKSACIENPAKFVWTQDEGSVHGMTRFSLDLEDHSRPIYLIAANSLIGNGGGPYHAFKVQDNCYFHLGTLFLQRGAFQILQSKHHGLRDIKSYNHMSAGSGTLTIYQFNGSEYVALSSREIPSEDFKKEIISTKLKLVEVSKDGKHWNSDSPQ